MIRSPQQSTPNGLSSSAFLHNKQAARELWLEARGRGDELGGAGGREHELAPNGNSRIRWSKKGDRPESGATPKQRHSMRLGQDTGPDQTSSTLIHPAWSFQWGGEVGGKIGEIGDAWGNGRNCGEMENSGEGIGPDGSLDRSKSSKKKARLKKSCSLMQSSSLPTI
ncbi:hypothetical protein AYI68_g1890 [Smittium mucronatum]|uniref:Uncharacterized protein n=1 Tax=Smittium mucronatum TaxID=133383 RepID=A0A1R0H476_9FUNG|nr:hypothetical protein AYI68_g1890 [Smittium mucronatum]